MPSSSAGVDETETTDSSFCFVVQMDRDLGYTDYWNGFEGLMKTPSEGAATYVYAAFDPSLQKHNGAYLANSQVQPPEKIRSWARDPVEAELLWKLSEQIVGQKFEY